MDDEQVLRARQVAVAAAAWLHARADAEAYRRLVLAAGHWAAYRAPHLGEQPDDEIAAQLRRAARRAFDVMDEDAARLAVAVADAALTWLGPSGSGASYDRLGEATGMWVDYCTPQLPDPAVEELLDQLGDDDRAPVSIGDAVRDVTARLTKDTGLR
ncbi:hypothetical protein K8Z61_18125 [Nocardioides sp. TRM66260-LWL]|uniref:hypothetical protein n=1 Tax=Nocardioides sp. TRM66260-LWL TaxID=2874478 RepID=UPI001CC54FF7|nr:hypothetical protein [Nocardioides sp. TRM66260-LWL]MBZ5736413.1 hypothetical protein [Nocardioides sp. TRM66260-LWL]